MEKKNRNTEQLTKHIFEFIDEIGVSIKKASSTFFDSLVIITKETFSNKFEKCKDKTKKKIIEKVSIDDDKNDVSK